MSRADTDAVLARARAYPYEAPSGSYLYADGRVHPLSLEGPDPVGLGRVTVGSETQRVVQWLMERRAMAQALSHRTPVIAYGSNRAPEQIVRKFGDWPGTCAIPVTCGRLRGFDVVFAPRFAHYGSVSATLAVSPGTSVAVSVTWLTPAQLETMHETEGVDQHVYAFGRLRDTVVQLEGGFDLREPFVYVTNNGALTDEGRPVALAALGAEGRHFPEATQTEMLEQLRRRIASTQTADEFVLAHVRDEHLRRERNSLLAAEARLFRHPSFEILLGGPGEGG